jgi:signal transduction histidine kinase
MEINAIRLGEIYVRRETDIVKVRERVRGLARELGFDTTTQIKITTAVSEVTRNIYEYARHGTISLALAEREELMGLQVMARDEGPGIDETTLNTILRGGYQSRSGMGIGLSGTRRLMDEFDVQSAVDEGTRITVVKWLPRAATNGLKDRVEELRTKFNADDEDSAIEVLQQQNRDFVAILSELEEKREQLEATNHQLNESNQELNEANAKLRELSVMKEDFLALTTHDLRSPLSVISGVISFFTSGRLGELSPEQKNMVAMMERNTQSLIELVNDLLDASKLESGTMRLDITSIDLSGLIQELHETMGALAVEKGITLTETLPADLPPIKADRAKVRRVLVNLLSNALKFTRKGGRVEIKIEELGERIRISVIDTGVGIAPEDVARLFDKYEQARSRATHGEKGTGLGLYITRQLVELHDSHIEVQSKLGHGSTFSFTLPTKGSKKN